MLVDLVTDRDYAVSGVYVRLDISVIPWNSSGSLSVSLRRFDQRLSRDVQTFMRLPDHL